MISKSIGLGFIELILSKKAFNETLKLYLEKASKPSSNEIVAIMKQSNLNNVESDSTYFRRASTVLKWINWIVDYSGPQFSDSELRW